jgi:hypothetical protein
MAMTIQLDVASSSMSQNVHDATVTHRHLRALNARIASTYSHPFANFVADSVERALRSVVL